MIAFAYKYVLGGQFFVDWCPPLGLPTQSGGKVLRIAAFAIQPPSRLLQ